MAQNITLMGASYSAVPAVTLPKTGGGTASFTDVSDTTATAADVASGTYFYTAAGEYTEGTASGGGGGNNVTISWNTMGGIIDLMYYPNSATVDVDPDSPWITIITLPENSLICGRGTINSSASVSGLTYQKIQMGGRSPYAYLHLFFVETTNGSITA